MVSRIMILLLVLAAVLPVGIYYIRRKKVRSVKRTLAVNMGTFFVTLVVATVFIFSDAVSAAEAVTAAGSWDISVGLGFLAAALSTGLGSIGAGVATGQAAGAALGALSENEGIMGKALIFVALAEGIAIYGLIISVMIIGNVTSLAGL